LDCFTCVMIWKLFLVALILNVVSASTELQNCVIPGVKGHVQCGQVQVAENRNQQGGRVIELKVIELQAEMQPKRPDPLYVLQGGPGQPVTQLASYYGRVFSALRKFRDIVLVDVRGTGQSNGLYTVIFSRTLLLASITFSRPKRSADVVKSLRAALI
jgi:pimeloyl-ACP methyl ester carboxylesterase